MTLQQAINRDIHVEQILKEFELDFYIHKVPSFYQWNGEWASSRSYSLVNSKIGKEIANVTKQYQVTQNKEVVHLILTALEEFGDLTINNAIVINNGRRIFYQIELNSVSLINGDEIKKFITVIDSNDKSAALSIGIGNKVKSCDNQFWSFYKDSQFKFYHNQSVEQKLKLLPKAIQESISFVNETSEWYLRFAQVQIDDKAIDTMIQKLLNYKLFDEQNEPIDLSTRKQNQIELLKSAIFAEMIQKGQTLWGLFNGITYYTTHDAGHPKRKNGDVESLIGGNNYRLNNMAFNLCKNYYDRNKENQESSEMD